jgi:hypothetical protein
VLTFDKRKTDKYIEILNEGSHNFSPVCSLQYVPKSPEAAFKSAGLLVTQLDRLCFFEEKENQSYVYNPLLLENNIMSCSFEANSRRLLITTRPSQKHPNVRHLIYEFGKRIVYGHSFLDHSKNDQIRIVDKLIDSRGIIY